MEKRTLHTEESITSSTTAEKLQALQECSDLPPRRGDRIPTHTTSPTSPTSPSSPKWSSPTPTSSIFSSPASTLPTTPTSPTSLTAHLARRNPALKDKLNQMRLTLAPIVHCTTGHPPPAFPSTLLSLFLLTEPQLDALASYYCQTPASQAAHPDEAFAYPQMMDWSRPILDKPRPGEPKECTVSDLERLRIKGRMFARFIGMRGAETPGWETRRSVEILNKRIEWTLKVEKEQEDVGRKFFGGPPGTWW